ncbi:MAG: MBL fold metallo-hydrolase [Armatimonadota bacterium]
MITKDIHNISIDSPSEGNVLVYWLGAAGFAFKFSTGEIICIDPYLSDYVERMFDFRRLSLPAVDAKDLRFDTLLITHEHGDHLDVDSFDTLMAGNPDCEIIAPPACEGFLLEHNANYIIANPGIIHQSGNISIEVVDADHGDETPDAVGFLIHFGSRKIYFTGDTGYNPSMMKYAIDSKPEIVIPCINGAYGNLNDDESAALVAECEAKVAIPSHFWLFAEHGIGSPGIFKENVEKKSPGTTVHLLTPGRAVEV